MPGIYKIENLVNGKLYIGATTRSFMERWSKHKSDLKKQRHGNIHLQRSWDKHGETNFKFEILENINNPSPKLLSEKEEYYAKLLKSYYNIAPFDRPFSITYGRKLSPEHIEKLRKCQLGRIWTDEERKKLSISLKGHYQPPCTPEHRKHLSDALKGKSKKPFSEEHRRNISISKMGIGLGRTVSKEVIEKISKNRMGKCMGIDHPVYKGLYVFIHPIHGTEIIHQWGMVKKYGLTACKMSLLCSGKRHSHAGWICKGRAQ